MRWEWCDAMAVIDYILLGLIGLGLSFAFGLWRKRRKEGKTCCGDCAGCACGCKK